MVKMLMKKFSKKSSYLKSLEQKTDSKKFVLSYSNNIVGYLKHIDNQWIFVYSDWFKNQDRLMPLVEFPKKNATYKSNELWPFFTSRIPSEKQIKLRNIQSNRPSQSIEELLEKFGKQTINNPFVLETT